MVMKGDDRVFVRQQLETHDLNGNAAFWRDIGAEFNNNLVDYNELLSTNARFSSLDPSVIVAHDALKLHEMWKHVNSKYVKAMAKFTRSGEHSSVFFAFCDGSIDVLYLRVCLQVKTNLTQFVAGGFLEEYQFDSLKRTASNNTAPPPAKKWKSELFETIKVLSDKVLASTASPIDELMKLNQLVNQIEDRIEFLKSENRPVAHLLSSLSIYREKLAELEAQFSKPS